MSFSILITDDINKIQKEVNSALAQAINDELSKNLNNILNSVKALIPPWIMSQPEIVSLQSSDITSLAGQFGIAGSASQVVNSIIDSVVNATEIKLIPYSKNLKGGLELRFQPSTFANLLILPEGHTIYNNGDLHWLDWLLKRGDNIIVINYQYNPKTGLGRSRLGNMIPGGSFRVPPQFSGTDQDNFITRAFIGQTQESQITSVIQRMLS